MRDLEQTYRNFYAGRAKFPRFKGKAFAGAVRYTLDQRRTQVERQIERDGDLVDEGEGRRVPGQAFGRV